MGIYLVACSVCVFLISCFHVEGSFLISADRSAGRRTRPGNHNGYSEDPEVHMNVTQMITSKGYPCEEHNVITEDGYILAIQRIPGGRHQPRHSNTDGRPVVFLQHGLLSSSDDWVDNLVNESLAFLLADAGYDVWLGNSRGNTYGRRHKTLTTNDDIFWDFSWDEMAEYDLPATVETILQVTGVRQLSYVGYSQGAEIAFAALSYNHALAEKLRVFIALAPVAYTGNIKSPIRLLAPFANDLELLFYLFGVRDFLPSSPLIRWLGQNVCGHDIPAILCENVLFLLGGYDKEQMNITRLPVYIAHSPAGTSVRNIVHYAQTTLSGKFQKFNFGATENMRRYNQVSEKAKEMKTSTMLLQLEFKKQQHEIATTLIKSGIDRTGFTVNYINDIIGCGVFAMHTFKVGEFLLEYRGELITYREALRREVKYKEENLGSFLFFFKYGGKGMCVDATHDDMMKGRMINDSPCGDSLQNCQMKVIIVDKTPRLCIFATRDIKRGEELRYDYGVQDLPWRKQKNVQNTNALTEIISSQDISPCQTNVKTDAVKSLHQNDMPTGVNYCKDASPPDKYSLTCHQSKTQNDQIQDVGLNYLAEDVPSGQLGCQTDVSEPLSQFDKPLEDENPYLHKNVPNDQTESQMDVSDPLSQCSKPLHFEDQYLQNNICDEKANDDDSVAGETYCPQEADVPNGQADCQMDVSDSLSQCDKPLDEDQYLQNNICDEKANEDDSVAGETYCPQEADVPNGQADCQMDVSDSLSPCDKPLDEDQYLQNNICDEKANDNDSVAGETNCPQESDVQNAQTDCQMDVSDPLSQCDKPLDDEGQYLQNNISDEEAFNDDSDADETYCPQESVEERNQWVNDSLLGTDTSSSSTDDEVDVDEVDVNEIHIGDSNSKTRDGLNTAIKLHLAKVTVPLYTKKSDGKRNYSKVNYCMYCQREYSSKISEHYINVHHSSEEVKKAMMCPKGSKERRRILMELENRGNYQHNVKVFENGFGELVVARRPSADRNRKYSADDFLPCQFCLGFYLKDSLWLHMSTCLSRPQNRQPSVNCIRDAQVMISSFIKDAAPEDVQLETLFSGMKETKANPGVSELCRRDSLIREFAKSLMCRLGENDEQRIKDIDNIRTKVRTVGRLLNELAEEETFSQPLDNYICGQRFNDVVNATKSLALKSGSPQIALVLGHYIKQIALLKISVGIQSASMDMQNEGKDFQVLYQTHWNNQISSVAKRRQRLRALNKQSEIPTTDDLVTLKTWLVKELNRRITIETPGKEVWKSTAQMALVRIALFNKRRISEVQDLRVTDFLQADLNEEPDTEIFNSLDVSEKILSKRMKVMEVRGKSTRGLRKVFVILAPDMVEFLDYLMRTRCSNSPFLFCRQSDNTPMDGCEAMRVVTDMCPGLIYPKRIRTRKLRKYLATTSQIIDMTDSELKMVADHMGHNMNVHTDVYRLQTSLIEKTKVARVLIAMENGHVQSFNGKNLQEISLGDLPDPGSYDDTWEVPAKQSGQTLCDKEDNPEHEGGDPDQINDETEIETCEEETNTATQKRKSEREMATKIKRPRWTEDENKVFREHFQTYISSGVVPPGSVILKVSSLIKTRSVPQIRTKLNNIVTGKLKKY